MPLTLPKEGFAKRDGFSGMALLDHLPPCTIPSGLGRTQAPESAIILSSVLGLFQLPSAGIPSE